MWSIKISHNKKRFSPTVIGWLTPFTTRVYSPLDITAHSLPQAVDALYMGKSKLPRLIVQLVALRVRLADRLRYILFPIGRAEAFSYVPSEQVRFRTLSTGRYRQE